MTTTDWNPILRGEFDKPYWREAAGVRARRAGDGSAVYPPHDEVFAALHLTPYASVKVLVLGQDPYHGAGQAHGLCFSVRPGVAAPPSLVNIYAELEADLGIPPADHGHLTHWATQGVLLLNTTLTVQGPPGRVPPEAGLGDLHRRGDQGGFGQDRSGWSSCCGERPPAARRS